MDSGEIKWRCCRNSCSAFVKTIGGGHTITNSRFDHNHEPLSERKLERQRLSSSAKRKAEEIISNRPEKIMRSVLTERSTQSLQKNEILRNITFLKRWFSEKNDHDQTKSGDNFMGTDDIVPISELHDSSYFDIIVPEFEERVKVKWYHQGVNTPTQDGDAICEVLSTSGKTMKIFSPASGVIQQRFVDDHEFFQNSRSLCRIRVYESHIDRDPIIVRVPVDKIDGTGFIHWFKGVGFLVEEGEVICEVIDEQKKLRFASPLDGIVGRIFVREGGLVRPFDKLFMVKSVGLTVESGGRKEDPTGMMQTPHGEEELSKIDYMGDKHAFLMSKKTSVVFKVDMSNALRFVNEFEKTGTPISRAMALTGIYVKASTYALKQHESFSWKIVNDERVRTQTIDLSVGIVSGMKQLFPTLESADKMSYADVVSDLTYMKKKIDDYELHGLKFDENTFTICGDLNSGCDIILPGLRHSITATLAVHSISKVPVFFNQRITARPMMYMALSYDRRLSDFNCEGLFLMLKIKRAIENPAMMIA